MKKFFIIVLLLSLLTCAGLGGYYLIYDRFEILELQILLTATLTGFFSVTCMACTLTNKTKNLKFYSNLGMFINIISYFFFVFLIWFVENRLDFLGNDFWKIIATVLTVCLFFTHGCLMFAVRDKRPAVVNSKTIAIMSSILGTILLLIVLWAGIRELFYLILLGVFGILFIFGTVLTPFFIPEEKTKRKEKEVAEITPIELPEVEEIPEVEPMPEPIVAPTPEPILEPPKPESIEFVKPPELEPKEEEKKEDPVASERIEYLFDELFQRVTKK